MVHSSWVGGPFLSVILCPELLFRVEVWRVPPPPPPTCMLDQHASALCLPTALTRDAEGAASLGLLGAWYLPGSARCSSEKSWSWQGGSLLRFPRPLRKKLLWTRAAPSAGLSLQPGPGPHTGGCFAVCPLRCSVYKNSCRAGGWSSPIANSPKRLLPKHELSCPSDFA